MGTQLWSGTVGGRAHRVEADDGLTRRYALIQAVGGAAKVALPILLTVLLARFALSLPLPSIAGPDLPSLPLPDLPDWSLPGWIEQVLGVVRYVWPVVLAYVLARAEINRRRRQDEKRDRA